MSFSKARIQRFNELTSEAPPPGAYDPKFDGKLKGSKVEKKNIKCSDTKSTTSSGAECNGSVSSRSASSVSAKPFRTPQVPKKRVVVKPSGMSCPRITKTKLYSETKDPLTPYETHQELADLLVECDNKSKTIKENEKFMEDMKLEIKSLTEKYEALQKKHSEIEDQHQKDIESMTKLQQEVLGNKNEKYQSEIQRLQTDLAAALKAKEEITYEKNEMEKELTERITLLELETQKQVEQCEIAEKMKNLELATKKLNQVSKDLTEALNMKNQELAELVQLQTETECKLQKVQEDLKKSENQAADLEAHLNKMVSESSTETPLLNRETLLEMTEVLQEYFNYDNYDGKWNIENKTFHPDVENFLLKVKKFVTDLKSIYEREIELSRDNFNEERENLEQELESKRNLIGDLENKLSEVNETNDFLTEELQETQKLYKDANRSLMELKAEVDLANDKYTKAVTAHKAESELTSKIHSEEQKKLKDLLEEARSEYLKELENMTTARNKELAEVKQAMEKRIEDEKKRMKECAKKMVDNAEAVTRETLKACEAASAERVKRVIAESDAKISLLTREAKSAAEEELRQVTEKFNACLDGLENEKESISAKLAQRDLDVIKLTAAIEEMKCTLETQESFSQSLQSALDSTEAELVEKKDELRNLKDQIRTESAEMVARKRLLEVVMAENQASITALTRRLAQSEAEVERLQSELQTRESSLVGYRETFETMTESSKMMQEQLDSISDKIEEKTEAIEHMEAANISEINAVKTAFTSKIDSLKNYTIEELAKAQQECKERSEQNFELKESLQQMSEKLNESTVLLLKLEEVNDEQAIDLAKLETKNFKLQQQLEDKNRIINETQASFKKYQEQHKIEMDQIHEQLAALKGEIKVVEQKKNEVEEKKYDYEELQFKHKDELNDLTQKLEKERSERQKLEAKLKEYIKNSERLNVESKTFTEKSTETINHSGDGNNSISNKQRTKHVSQLKEKINTQQLDLLRLRQELDLKSNLVDELRMANEKLKLDERRLVGLGKENLHSLSSPQKSFPKSSNNPTPISSPHKPHTPLRDRND